MSKGGGTSTTVQSQSIPSWLEGYDQSLTSSAQNGLNAGYTQYGGEQVAPLTAMQTQAGNVVQSGLGNWQKPMQAGVDLLDKSSQTAIPQVSATGTNSIGGQLASGNLATYMNPNVDDVVNKSMTQLDQSRQNALNQIGDQAIQAGAFGGSRQGVAEGVTNAMAAQQAGLLSSQLYGQAYDNATGLMKQDVANNLTAQQANQNAGLVGQQNAVKDAAMYGTLGSQMQTANLADANALNTLGTQAQTTQQNIDSNNVSNFNTARDWNVTQAGKGASIASGLLGGNVSSSTTTPTTQNGLLTGLGGAAMGASLLGSMGGSSGLGAGLGALLAFSDKRLKKDIEKVGKAPSGVDIVDFRWKGQPKKAPKTRGLLAQDVEKKVPDAVVDTVTGYKAVNYPRALLG